MIDVKCMAIAEMLCSSSLSTRMAVIRADVHVCHSGASNVPQHDWRLYSTLLHITLIRLALTITLRIVAKLSADAELDQSRVKQLIISYSTCKLVSHGAKKGDCTCYRSMIMTLRRQNLHPRVLFLVS